jgi:hypothetical protein
MTKDPERNTIVRGGIAHDAKGPVPTATKDTQQVNPPDQGPSEGGVPLGLRVTEASRGISAETVRR